MYLEDEQSCSQGYWGSLVGNQVDLVAYQVEEETDLADNCIDFVENQVVEGYSADLWPGFDLDKKKVGPVGSQADLGHSWAHFDNIEADFGLEGNLVGSQLQLEEEKVRKRREKEVIRR